MRDKNVRIMRFPKQIQQIQTYIFLAAMFLGFFVFMQPADAAERINRLAGYSRYDTAVEVAKEGWPSGADTAILAYGENFPDALTAVPLAQKLNAPILLTEKERLTSVTAEVLQNANIRQVIIVGGTGVISSAVEQQLAELGLSWVRLAGWDCYATSVEIAKYMNTTAEKLVVTSGKSFQCALMISSYAGKNGIPIILADMGATSHLEQYLRDHTVKKTYVISKGNDLPSSMDSLFPNPTRIAGSDAYDTNLKILEKFDYDYSLDNVYVATGNVFADALAGSVLAAKESAPILLLKQTRNMDIACYLAAKNKSIQRFTVLGGEAVVSATLMQRYLEYMDRFQNLRVTTINELEPLMEAKEGSNAQWIPFADQHNVPLDTSWTINYSSNRGLDDVKGIFITKKNELHPVSWKSMPTYDTVIPERLEANSLYKLTIMLKNGLGYYLYFDTYQEDSAKMLKQQYQSQHFVFYTSDQDKAGLADVAAALEKNYTQVQKNLDTRLDGLQRIEIYPDGESYLEAAGFYDWAAANAFVGAIQAISRHALGCSQDEFVRILTHEFTHNLNAALNINSELPMWLNEGVANFEGKINNDYESILEYVDGSEIPTFEELDDSYEIWPYIGGYELSYTIIEYFLEIYDYEKLRAVIKNPANFEEVTGQSLSDFEAAWRKAVKAKYRAFDLAG